MPLQCTFSPQYVNKLRNNINPEDYFGKAFPLDDAQVLRLSGINAPSDLEARMLAAPTLVEAAIMLYEAYSALPPTYASREDFWVYLTHVDLFNYVKLRWPEYQQYTIGSRAGVEKTHDESLKYIREHWFFSRNGIMRTSLMGLWWSVYLTIDPEHTDDPYWLTRQFFANDGMRTRRLGTGHLGRNKEALHGILRFMVDNPSLFDELENRVIWITRHFNLIGGGRPLSCQPAKYFYDELKRNSDHIALIKSRADVQGPNIYI